MSDELTELEIADWLATIPGDEQEALKTCYAKGDPMPSGYVHAHDWAQAQYLHGLRQTRCDRCRRYFFPQELRQHVSCEPPKPRKRASPSGGEK